MSHKATNWLSGIPAPDLGNSEFRVLFHLCDCHNPSNGCFPTQAYLIDVCGVSNGTLNNALNGLETKGHIQRHKSWDGKSRRQMPTRYILGFEMSGSKGPSPKTGGGKGPKPSPKTGGGKRPAPSPKTGDGKRPKPSPKTGDGADSSLRGEPSPVSGATRLQPTGEVTCKEPVINPSADPDLVKICEFWIDKIEQGSFIPAGAIPPSVVAYIIETKRLTPEQLRSAGVDC